MIRILHILPRMPVGGVGSFLMNTQKTINKERFSFDYLVIENVIGASFPLVVEEMGSKVYILNDALSLANTFKIQNDINSFFRQHANEYDIVHLHSANVGMLVFPAAKKNGIAVRVLHAHATKYSDNWIKSIRNWILEMPVLGFATNLVACGKKAGDFQFKKHSYDIVYNGIDTDLYHYRHFDRNREFVIGHVGNFIPYKNHEFLLDVMESLKLAGFKCEMWFAGTGPLEEKIQNDVKQKGLEDRIKFLGRVDHTEVLYNQIDLLVLPSLYEGFPVALMEAQACGTPIICSDRVTREVDFYNDCMFLPIDKNGVERWTKAIMNGRDINREEKAKAFQNSQFTLDITVSHLEELYIKYFNLNK